MICLKDNLETKFLYLIYIKTYKEYEEEGGGVLFGQKYSIVVSCFIIIQYTTILPICCENFCFTILC